MSRPTEAERLAISAYLAPWDGRSANISTLEAGLRDARETMLNGKALWLATLGYLVVAEQVGRFIARPKTVYPRSGSEECSVAGLRELAPRRVGSREASGLYGLRCSLAHEYGLRNSARNPKKESRVFVLAQAGPLIRHARVKWDGTSKGALKHGMRTWVSVRAVGDLVEDVVSNARQEHQRGAVRIAPKQTAEDLLLCARFRVG